MVPDEKKLSAVLFLEPMILGTGGGEGAHINITKPDLNNDAGDIDFSGLIFCIKTTLSSTSLWLRTHLTVIVILIVVILVILFKAAVDYNNEL